MIIAPLFSSVKAVAQKDSSNQFLINSVFEKKWFWGFGVNNSWANYRDLKDSSFYRPSLGIHLKTEYFLTKSIGLTIGVGVQQRGMGIFTPDLDQSIGNPDSTGRLRYKSTTIDVPIQFLFRPEREVFKNGRIVAGLGITASYMYKALRIWKSVDDGFHEDTDITESFKTLDFPFRATIGTDVSVPGGSLFRAQLVGELGINKIYKVAGSNDRVGQNTLFGIDLSFLF
jgi:hypothetical protein